MTDKELLELAAKAAGIKKDDSPYNGGGHGNDGFDCMGNMVTDWHNNKRWNPLTDDRDALRLGVTLTLLDQPEFHQHLAIEQLFGKSRDCAFASTRRAIVMAAAEIGRAL